MPELLEISFVYSKDAVKIKSFLGLVPRSIECINYMDIYNKLAKNDYLQNEPSDIVVSSYLMKQLQSSISLDTTASIFYVLGEFDRNVIISIKDYIESITTRPIRYMLYHTHEVSLNGMNSLFDGVVKFDADL